MAKDIILGKEAKEKLIAGVNKLSEVVGLTLGPRGQNGIIGRGDEAPLITNDGISIAREVDLEDPFENMGAKLVIEVASKTNTVAGDGTTTSTVLTKAIVNEGMNAIKNGTNPILLKNGMDMAIKDIEKIISKMKKEITDFDEIKKIATISSGNEEIGELIGGAIEKMGKDGIITLDDSENYETKIIVSEGYEIDRGFISHLMITDHKREKTILNNPLIYITNKALKVMADVLPVLQIASENSRDLFIIADGLEGQALETVLFNLNVVNTLVVKPTGFGEEKNSILEDIASIVGAKMFNDKIGNETVKNISQLGTAASVESDKNKTVIIEGKKDIDRFNERIEIVSEQIDKSNDEYIKDALKERLAKLKAGVAVIKCGAKTETEQIEKKLRIEDSINATRAAIDYGIVPGGGAALLHAFNKITIPNDLDKEKRAGYMSVVNSMTAPIQQILTNSNLNKSKIDTILSEIISSNNENLGYDAMDFAIKDFYEAGIIDPAKVTITALENAVSIASTLLTTNAAIIPLDRS